MSFLIFVENALWSLCGAESCGQIAPKGLYFQFSNTWKFFLNQAFKEFSNINSALVMSQTLSKENRNLSFKVHCLALTNFSRMILVKFHLYYQPEYISVEGNELCWMLDPPLQSNKYTSCHERYTVIIRAVSDRPFPIFKKHWPSKWDFVVQKSPWENDLLSERE